MVAIGSGFLASEQKVTEFARGDVSVAEAESTRNGAVEFFHDHKFKAIGAFWAGTVLSSLVTNQSTMPFHQRVITARIVAQGATIGAILALGVSTWVFPDPRERTGYAAK